MIFVFLLFQYPQINARIHDRFHLRTSVWIKEKPFCHMVHIDPGSVGFTLSIFFKAVQEESYRSTLNMEANIFFKTTAIWAQQNFIWLAVTSDD
jgi:hypothetical protein